jgi:4,5-DOPA dioxygenase extradiol
MNRMPTLFVSHGAPTFALEPGRAGVQLSALGRALKKPGAIAIVSPHWMTPGVEVTASTELMTIHDFGGFPDALYQLSYGAPGSPMLARRIVEVLETAGIEVKLNDRRGLDHGAWVPLRYLYPDADVPVVQVSMPTVLDAQGAYDLGQALAPLADEGVLIIGSGSLTHNLYEFRSGAAQEAGYAREFTTWVREAVLANNVDRLRRTLELAPHARRAHPTVEHFLPLLIALGAARNTSRATVLDGGIRHGVLAMESFLFGRELVLDVADDRLITEATP